MLFLKKVGQLIRRFVKGYWRLVTKKETDDEWEANQWWILQACKKRLQEGSQAVFNLSVSSGI